MKHEQPYINRRRAVAIVPMLATLGFVFGKYVSNELKPTNCDGIQSLEINSGDTFDSLASNVERSGGVTKSDIVDILIEINPTKKIGELAIGDRIIAPISCEK